MIKAVIFDMDGLMIETEHLQSKSFEHVLREHGAEPEFNKDGMIQTVGVNARDNFVRLKEKHNINEDVDSLLKKKQKFYWELLSENIEPKKGLLNLIDSLKKAGFKLGVASSSKIEHINLVLKGLEVKEKFDVIISGENIKRGKPFPDIFLSTAKKLGIDPVDCLVLEDAESGVEAAYAAEMKIIAVPNQYTRSHSFDKATKILSSLEEISLELISKL